MLQTRFLALFICITKLQTVILSHCLIVFCSFPPRTTTDVWQAVIVCPWNKWGKPNWNSNLVYKCNCSSLAISMKRRILICVLFSSSCSTLGQRCVWLQSRWLWDRSQFDRKYKLFLLSLYLQVGVAWSSDHTTLNSIFLLDCGPKEGFVYVCLICFFVRS